MRINRAVGLLLFLLCAQFLLSDVVRSVSQAVVATMTLVETTSHTAALRLEA